MGTTQIIGNSVQQERKLRHYKSFQKPLQPTGVVRSVTRASITTDAAGDWTERDVTVALAGKVVNIHGSQKQTVLALSIVLGHTDAETIRNNARVSRCWRMAGVSWQ